MGGGGRERVNAISEMHKNLNRMIDRPQKRARHFEEEKKLMSLMRIEPRITNPATQSLHRQIRTVRRARLSFSSGAMCKQIWESLVSNFIALCEERYGSQC